MQPNSNFGSDAALYIGRDPTGEGNNILIQWDLSSLPDCIEIIFAEIQIYQWSLNSGTVAGYVKRILDPWNELTVTWANQPNISNSYGTQYFNSTPDWRYIPSTDLVIDWLILGNNGVMLQGTSNSTNYQICNSRENVQKNPKLKVTYNIINPPSSPTAVSAINITNNSFRTNWNISNGAAGYRLDVAINNTFTNYVSGYHDLDVSNVTSWNITNLDSGTIYYYRVRAYNGVCTSGNSNTISVITIPPAAIAISATNVTNSSLIANWNIANGASGFQLDVATNSSFTYFVLGYQNLDVGNVTSHNVTGLNAGTTYYYRIRAYNSSGVSGNSNTILVLVTSVEQIGAGLPLAYELTQNYPNPFNPSTTIRFAVLERSKVQLVIFNLLGESVATLVDEELDAGWYETNFSGVNLASGVYFYRMQAGSFTETKKFILMK